MRHEPYRPEPKSEWIDRHIHAAELLLNYADAAYRDALEIHDSVAADQWREAVRVQTATLGLLFRERRQAEAAEREARMNTSTLEMSFDFDAC